MIAIFRDKSIVTIFILALLCVAVHAHIFVHPIPISNAVDNGLISNFIGNYLAHTAPAFLTFLYIFILFAQAVLLNTILNEWKMYQKSAFTTAAAFILITAVYPELNTISPAMINNFLVILFIALYARMYNNQKPNSLLFNIGFIICLSVFLYKANIIFFFISFLALSIIRPFRLKEWIILLIGILVPVYLIGSLLFVYDKFEVIKTYIPYFQMHSITLKITVWFWINSAVLTLALLIGINQWLPNYDRMVIHIRRNWIILFLSLIILTLLPFTTYKGNMLDFWMLIPVAASFIASLFLYPKRLLIPNFIFILLLILITHTNLLMMGILKK